MMERTHGRGPGVTCGEEGERVRDGAGRRGPEGRLDRRQGNPST